ncbi:MAG: hypothetical protein VKJ09_04005 [Leptolyngbya sp.]|nr:hypothetical protein [Leptolyngbya sp.]
MVGTIRPVQPLVQPQDWPLGAGFPACRGQPSPVPMATATV